MNTKQIIVGYRSTAQNGSLKDDAYEQTFHWSTIEQGGGE